MSIVLCHMHKEVLEAAMDIVVKNSEQHQTCQLQRNVCNYKHQNKEVPMQSIGEKTHQYGEVVESQSAPEETDSEGWAVNQQGVTRSISGEADDTILDLCACHMCLGVQTAVMDIEDLGLCQWAFAMEVDEGTPHCSILCSRTCNPEVATPHSTFDIHHARGIAATKLISYHRRFHSKTTAAQK